MSEVACLTEVDTRVESSCLECWSPCHVPPGPHPLYQNMYIQLVAEIIIKIQFVCFTYFHSNSRTIILQASVLLKISEFCNEINRRWNGGTF